MRPYRVGMSCGFCHVGPSPIAPPDDPENPKWENINATVGSQYFWIDRIFAWEADPANYMYQLVHTQRPGTLDTSLVSTDYINNPRTMNAIYNLGPRLDLAKRWGEETLGGGELNNKQFNDYVADGPLTELFKAPNTSYSPRVLKDGADSVGALGALNRVYLNIGLYSEEWTRHFNPIVGGKPITPIEIAVAQEKSSYWQATEAQTPLTALYFLKAGRPDKLADAPGWRPASDARMRRCSSAARPCSPSAARAAIPARPPSRPQGLDPGGCSGPNYLQCWNKYWAWTKTDDYKAKMKRDRARSGFPRRQLSSRPSSACR